METMMQFISGFLKYKVQKNSIYLQDFKNFKTLKKNHCRTRVSILKCTWGWLNSRAFSE